MSCAPRFRCRRAGIAHILAVACTAEQDFGAGDVAAHVAQGVAGQFGHVQGACIVDVDGGGGNPEEFVAVFESQDVFVRPVTQSAVFWQAIAADSGAGEDDIAVGRPHFNGIDDLDEVHAIALGKQAPFVEESQDCGAV